jgi:hypothetical protein
MIDETVLSFSDWESRIKSPAVICSVMCRFGIRRVSEIHVRRWQLTTADKSVTFPRFNERKVEKKGNKVFYRHYWILPECFGFICHSGCFTKRFIQQDWPQLPRISNCANSVSPALAAQLVSDCLHEFYLVVCFSFSLVYFVIRFAPVVMPSRNFGNIRSVLSQCDA